MGLLRVGIEASEVDAQLRKGALEGRLIVTTAKQRAISSSHAGPRRLTSSALACFDSLNHGTSPPAWEVLPGAAYRLLAADAGAQFAELLTVLGVNDAVDAGGACA